MYFYVTRILSHSNHHPQNSNSTGEKFGIRGIGTLFVKIGQNGEMQCFMIGRQPGNRAWPITQEP